MKTRRTIRVLAATQNEQVYDILGTRDDAQFDIALYTGTIRDLLPHVQLVVIDYQDLVEHPLTETEIREEIHKAGVLECSSRDFESNPQHFLGSLVTNRAGQMLSLPDNYCVAFVSLSGGTGRTTLAMDTAMYYAKAMGKAKSTSDGDDHVEHRARAALFEMAYGVSSLVSLTGLEMPHLYQLVTDGDIRPQQFKGADIYPMDYENVRVLTTAHIKQFFANRVVPHGLVVIDSIWPHGHTDAISEYVNLWLVVASERPDTIANATTLRDTLVESYGADKVWLIQNQVEGKRDLGKQGSDSLWRLRLPRIGSADDLRGDLGEMILKEIYAPIWEGNSTSRSSGLFS